MKTSEMPSFVEQLRQDWPLYAMLGVVVVITAALYGRIPHEVPIHWNWRGVPDGYTTRAKAVVLLPSLAVLIHLLTVGLTRIDPRMRRLGQSPSVLRLFRVATPGFLLCLHVISLAVWLGKPLNLLAVVYAGSGVLFAVLGNAMGRLRPNYFMGIRLPWTLESEVVWKKTHRFAGRLWFIGGCALVFTPILPAALQIVYFFGVTAVLTIAPGIFAYQEYQREVG